MGGKGSGGFREKASQNNPMNISATGGAGQSGRDYSGMAYGQNKITNDQKRGARMQGPTPVPPAPVIAPPTANPQTPQGQPSPLLGMPALHEMQPTGKPITDGVNFGPGAGSEALPNNLNPDRRPIENADLIKSYLPDLINAARVQNAPDSYKRFVNYLKGQL